jgi:hypothetical protein
MRNLLLHTSPLQSFRTFGALGHEAHHAECNDTAINALKADIQAMGAGEAKTTATKEMEAALQMMAKNDIEACKSHIHSAIEATECYSACNFDPLSGVIGVQN